MRKFHHILFVTQGVTDATDALKQALSIARNNEAELKALIVCPEFPKEMTEHKDKYIALLEEQLQKSLQLTREIVGVSEPEVPVQIKIESGSTPAVRIVRHVLHHAHDLVLKEAEWKDGGKGFKSIDMDLLRMCPCPVWLSHPISKNRNEMKVAVAIDPESIAPEGHSLSLRLLEVSRSLADTCNGELNIISCWDYPFEEYLRRNLWVRIPDDELLKVVHAARNEHRAILESLIKESGVSGKLQVHHVRGRADQMIPQFAADKGIDILVMGTVARSGIPGFVIGNTAENIIQKLGCSLLALKPNGFVSPVKAYG